VIAEALASGPRTRQSSESLVLQSSRASGGAYTVLLYQKMGRHLYFDEACFATDATITAENPCVP